MTRTTAAIGLGIAIAIGISGCSLLPGAEAELTWEDSPLSAYLNTQGDMTEDEMQEHFNRQQVEVEELVAECMTEEGFEYTPVDYSQMGGGVVMTGDEWDPESREWVEEYGYGAINFPGRDAPVEETPFEDPNQEYVSTLSESEANAYYETLHGVPPTEEELGEDGSYEYNWEEAGCYGKAQHEVSGDDPYSSEEHKPVMDALSEFYTTVQAAPELSELNEAWSSCMTEAGYSGFATQQEAQQSIYDELNAYYENVTEFVEDDPALLEIGERELELALADLECRESTDYRQESLRIQFAMEEEFIQEHQAELDALKEALELQQAA